MDYVRKILIWLDGRAREQRKVHVVSLLPVLDAVSLPFIHRCLLLNSLTYISHISCQHLRTSIRSGLGSFVFSFHNFCLSCHRHQRNPSAIFGLSPPGFPRSNFLPALNSKSFDRHAAYRFLLVFQCIVKIGIHGSEPIRSRAVQAGTLEVVRCVLEA